MELPTENRGESWLIERCRSGESSRFGELIRPYRSGLFSFLLRACGNRSQAEDLFQETLLRTWRGLNAYRHRSRFRAWLFSIARNVVRDEVRKEINRVHGDSVPLDARASNTCQPEEEFRARELAMRIQAALEDLTPRQRHVFLLRQHGSLTFREIAEDMGEPLSTVLGHMHYALGKLKRALEDKHDE